MDEGRRIQLEIMRRMTPSQRFQQAMALTKVCLWAREDRLRRTYPDATEDQLRELRIREALRLAPGAPLP